MVVSLVAYFFGPPCRDNESCEIRGGPKMATLPIINRFLKLFCCQNQEKICNNTIPKDPTAPQVCCYTTLWNDMVLQATSESSDFLALYKSVFNI